jgi:hypothetical protein
MEPKNWQPFFFLVGLSILIAVGSGWQYNEKVFSPNEQKIAELNQELEKVKVARQSWDEALARGVNGDAVYETRFNYFTKTDTPFPAIQPTLLKDLTPFMMERQMDFLSLTQQEIEKKELLTMVPFTMSGGGRFNDIIDLIRWLEEERHAVVSGLMIHSFVSDDKNGAAKIKPVADSSGISSELTFDYSELQHTEDWLFFSLKWHWVEGVPKNFISIVSVNIPPELGLLEIKRDPFSSYAQLEETVIPQKGDADKQEIVFQPAPDNLRLNGIMAVKNGFKALINNTYLEAGMNFEDLHVLEITADEVILGIGKVRYRLRMARKQY